MKNKIILLGLAIGIAFSGMAQTNKTKPAHRNGQVKHTVKHDKHVKVKAVKVDRPTTKTSTATKDAINAERQAINLRHKNAIAAVKANTTLTTQQQEEQIRLANVQHQKDIKALSTRRKG